MGASIYADSLTITTYILSLLWGVVSATVILANRRRRRLPFYYSGVLGARPRRVSTKPGAHAEIHRLSNSIAQPLSSLSPQATAQRPIPDAWRLPMQAATPEQVVIHIEPDGKLTNEQRDIQRIIQHLKTMSTKTNGNSP